MWVLVFCVEGKTGDHIKEFTEANLCPVPMPCGTVK